MTPAPGERFGPYDILAPLGRGGMGVVFRARDSRLGREVALKTLTADGAGDPARLKRFEQEARAASALNHPNVLTVYDVGVEGGTPFLVTELLEGETLRARLERGPLPPGEVASLGAQIARGLAAVHARGIVHRDLKPENLFLSGGGRVKILDFGVARTTEPPGTPGLTQTDAVLGTAGYMAPEQVRGRPADARSDLFALGAILLEALTGERAFPGETPVERGFATLNAEPAGDVRAVPSPLAGLVLRCLAKAAEARFQSAEELAFALEASHQHSPAPGRSGLHPAWLVALGVAALLGFALRGAVEPLPRATTAAPTPPPLAAPTTKRVSFRNGAIIRARFTADGRGVVYSGFFEGGPPRVYAGVLDGPQLRAVSAPWSLLLDVSPRDELALGLVPLEPRARAGLVLARAALGGGAPRALDEHITHADFDADDTLLLTKVHEQETALEYPPGTTLLKSPHQLDEARLSPDGRYVAFLRHPVVGDDRGTVEIIDRSGATVATSKPAWTLEGLAWAPSGREVWFSAGHDDVQRQLHALRLDGTERRVYGGPVTMRLHDVDGRGRALVTSGIVRARIFGRAAGDEAERSLSWLDGSMPLDLSADGRALLFLEGFGPAGKEVQTWLRRFGGDDDTPVLLALGWGRALSPDTAWAVVSPTPPFHTLRLVPTGAGQQRDLPAGDFSAILNVRYFADGRRIAFSAVGPDNLARLYVQAVDDAAAGPRLVADAPLQLVTPPSPDGRRAVALSRDRVPLLVEFETGATKELPGLAPRDTPVQWTSDGKGLWIARRLGPSRPLTVQVLRYELSTRRLTPGLTLGPADPVGMEQLKGGIVTPDGKHYAYTVHQKLDELFLLEGLR